MKETLASQGLYPASPVFHVTLSEAKGFVRWGRVLAYDGREILRFAQG